MGFLFDPSRLQQIAKTALDQPFDEMCQRLIDELTLAYPGHIEPRQEWVFSQAAGSTGVMHVLHGSLTEYLLLFGTPIGTEAFSGRYLLNIYDIVLAGEMQTYTEQSPGQAVVTRPGEMAALRKGQVKGFKLEPGSWMLEYGRGLIPSSLPTALSDSLLSSLDPQTVAKTFKVYGRAIFKELLQGKL